MRKRTLCTVLAASMALAACGSPVSMQITAIPGTEKASFAESETRTIGEQENQDTIEAETEASGEPYEVGIATPTLIVSEDEFRGAQEIVQRYPDLVVYKTLSENPVTDKEGCISVVISLADDPEMKYTLFNNGMEGIAPVLQTIREKRPDIVTMVTSNDDPKLPNDYADISTNIDWIRRGETIPTKAHDMEAKTFIHHPFPAHMVAESKAKRRDVMKEICEKLGMTWVEGTTPDPQTGNGAAAMLQFLREDILRKTEQYGPDTNILGTNCPTYDVILDEAFKGKFIIVEQCYSTPTQVYPTALDLEITEEDLGDYNKINNLVVERAQGAGMSGRLLGWVMPSSVYIPQPQVELAKYVYGNSLSPEDVLDRKFLNQFTSEHVPVAADFQVAGEGLEHYYMLSLEDIYYQDVERLQPKLTGQPASRLVQDDRGAGPLLRAAAQGVFYIDLPIILK